MCTHDLCFEQKKEKYPNFSSENYYFYSCEKSQYIARACKRNVPCSTLLSMTFDLLTNTEIAKINRNVGLK